MWLITVFILSGGALMVLTLAKRMENRKGKSNLVLKAISKGDEHLHDLNIQALHQYSFGKEKAAFWVKKQLPLRARGLFNKCLSFVREISEKHLGDIRDSKLLKKSDGLSEFFKNISEIERGGEINELFAEEATAETPVGGIVTEPETISAPEPRYEQAPTVIVRETKANTSRKRRTPKVKESPELKISPLPVLKSRRVQSAPKKRKAIKVLSQSVENVNW